jgi:hypothetical protein
VLKNGVCHEQILMTHTVHVCLSLKNVFFFHFSIQNKKYFAIMYGKLLLIIAASLLTLAMTLTMTSASPLQGGFGGVYDSPEAQEYWARRFGSGFFSNLASVQRDINQLAQKQRTSMDLDEPAYTPTFQFDNQIPDLIAEQIEPKFLNQKMVQAPKMLTVNPGPLYFGDF